MKEPYPLDERRDPDLWPFKDQPELLRQLLDEACLCGHPRKEHMAATGALGSFGGSACDGCWSCATFRPATRPGTAVGFAGGSVERA